MTVVRARTRHRQASRWRRCDRECSRLWSAAGRVDHARPTSPPPALAALALPLLAPLPLATVVVEVIAVICLLPGIAGIYSGFAATVALLRGRAGAEIAEQAAYGFAVGFLIGIPITISAGLALALGS